MIQTTPRVNLVGDEAAFLNASVIAAGWALGTTIMHMIDGVAFKNSHQHYEVISHDGDHIATLSTADVNFAIHFMKRRGREVGKLMGCEPFPNEPSFTFAWVGYLMHNGKRM